VAFALIVSRHAVASQPTPRLRRAERRHSTIEARKHLEKHSIEASCKRLLDCAGVLVRLST